MAERGGAEAFVSLATNNQYAHGAIALGKSLRNTGTQRKLVVMITSQVSEDMRGTLHEIWDEVVEVKELSSDDEEHLALLNRPELGVTFSKLNAWRLEQYSKCVFLDADTLVLTNVDELFEREELSAAPDIGWPDIFNSGVFVFCPNRATFNALMELAQQEGSFDGGDQGLLNTFWSDWSTKDISRHLPFTYNMVANASYGYTPAFRKFKDGIKIIHFIGAVKPWQHIYHHQEGKVFLCHGVDSTQCGLLEYIEQWWRVYCSTRQMTAEQCLEPLSFPPSPPPVVHIDQAAQEQQRRQEWESGHPDYHGADQFDNIQAHLDSQLD